MHVPFTTKKQNNSLNILKSKMKTSHIWSEMLFNLGAYNVPDGERTTVAPR